MFFKQKVTLPLVILSAAISLALSYAFGNDGYEAFVVTCIGLGILMVRQSIELVSLKQRWLIVQILLGILLLIVGLAVIAILIFALSPKLTNPEMDFPSVNWIIVAVSSLPFLFRPITQAHHHNLTQVTIHLITLVYSAILLYGAAISYYKAETRLVGLILVIAVQLQYVMTFIVLNTGYFATINRFFAPSGSFRGDAGNDLHLLVAGLPFFIPLTIIMIAGAIK